MLVLGIETSCDDTAAAVVEDGRRPLSSLVAAQDDLHAPFGGVVPEMASRRHLERIHGVVEDALRQAGARRADVDLVAVTAGPGLVGSLLVGLSYAKAWAYAARKPLVAVDHVLAHVFTMDVDGGTPVPSVVLVCSGGHTSLYGLRGEDEVEVLGATIDDAAGEALDKGAKMLGLGYPGGPAVEKAAAGGDPEAVHLPRPRVEGLDFSFSGLKTALFTHLRKGGYLDRTVEGRPAMPLADLAASYQAAVVEVLVEKCRAALLRYPCGRLLAVGGVARNALLRRRLAEAAAEDGFEVRVPPPALCTDNAAMVAALGYRRRADAAHDPLGLNAYSTKSLRLRGPHRKGTSSP